MLRCGWAHRTHHEENNKTGHERKGNRKKEGKKKKICGSGKRYRWLHSTSQSIHRNGTERNEISSAAASATHTHIRSAPQRQERDTTGANVYHPPIPLLAVSKRPNRRQQRQQSQGRRWWLDRNRGPGNSSRAKHNGKHSATRPIARQRTIATTPSPPIETASRTVYYIFRLFYSFDFFCLDFFVFFFLFGSCDSPVSFAADGPVPQY